MSKWLYFIIFFISQICFTHAQKAAQPIKFIMQIATVDIDYIFFNSEVGKSIEKYLNSELEKINTKRQKDKTAMFAEQIALNNQRKHLRKKDFEIKKHRLINLALEKQKNFEECNSQLRKIKKKAEEHVYHVLKHLIGKYAQDKGISIVLKNCSMYNSIILHADEILDISKQILEKLNQKINDITPLLNQFKQEI